MNSRLIVIDGKTYKSADEMPPDIRAKYEQAMSALKDDNKNNIPDGFENANIFWDGNKNGTPDVFENVSSTNVMTSSSSLKFIVNGQEFNNLEDLPPEARARYEQAMGTLDKNRNGVPDILENMMNMSNQTVNVENPSVNSDLRPASRAPQSVSPTVTPDTSNGWMLALAGIVVLGLCALGAVGVWYFFIR